MKTKTCQKTIIRLIFLVNYVVKHGDKPGSLISDVTNATFTVNLQDIPDDSTLILYVLTNIEPSINASHSNYQRTYFEKFDINNNKALELSYSYENLTKPIKSIKTFIEGQDQAAVITFTSPSKEYLNYNSTVNNVHKIAFDGYDNNRSTHICNLILDIQ